MGWREIKAWLLIHLIGLLSFVVVVLLLAGWHRPTGPLMRLAAKIPWSQTWPAWLSSSLTLIIGMMAAYAVTALPTWLIKKKLKKNTPPWRG